MDKFIKSEQKINLNHEFYNNKSNIIYKNESQNEKEVFNEIIIELEIYNNENEKEINILCDKNQVIKDNEKRREKKENINFPKEFNYFNKNNTKLYLNDKEIEFNYKLKLNKIGTHKIKIKSNINLISLSSMFYNCKNIINIKFIKINTNNVTDMSWMFSDCENISELNLSSFNIEKVKNMSQMFYYCKKLSKLDLSSFNTINVTNMIEMFSCCFSLSELNLSSFNTNNVIDMSSMFSNCRNLCKLDLSSFNTINVKDMSSMFSCCFKLSELIL